VNDELILNRGLCAESEVVIRSDHWDLGYRRGDREEKERSTMICHAKERRGAFAMILVVTIAAVAACSRSDLPDPSPSRAPPSPPSAAPPPVPVIGQQIAVPAYFTDWNGLLPYVPPVTSIVINPNNGPDPGHTSQISAAKARGALVLGYVYTKYANTRPNPLHGGVYDRTVPAVQADIDRYYSLYPNLDGIFLDEVIGSNCSHAQTYYRPIYDHIRSAHPNATVIINPGTAVDTCYLSVASIVVTFEGSFASYQNAWSTAGRSWETNANSARIWHIVHTASDSQWRTALELSRSRSAGYIYVTNLTAVQNTFGALPPYFREEAANVTAYKTSPP
jgi:hypothetical protein